MDSLQKVLFCGTLFSGCFDEQTSEEQHLFEQFCNSISIFTVTFDQFNVTLLNKSINIFKKILPTPNISELSYRAFYKSVPVSNHWRAVLSCVEFRHPLQVLMEIKDRLKGIQKKKKNNFGMWPLRKNTCTIVRLWAWGCKFWQQQSYQDDHNTQAIKPSTASLTTRLWCRRLHQFIMSLMVLWLHFL